MQIILKAFGLCFSPTTMLTVSYRMGKKNVGENILPYPKKNP